jgi:hypothetical protein
MTTEYPLEDFKIPFEEAKQMHENFFKPFRNRKSTKHVDFNVKHLKALIAHLKDEDKISFILAAHLRNTDNGIKRYNKKTWAEGKIVKKEELKNRVTLIIKAEAQKSVGAVTYNFYDAGALCPPPQNCGVDFS